MAWVRDVPRRDGVPASASRAKSKDLLLFVAVPPLLTQGALCEASDPGRCSKQQAATHLTHIRHLPSTRTLGIVVAPENSEESSPSDKSRAMFLCRSPLCGLSIFQFSLLVDLVCNEIIDSSAQLSLTSEQQLAIEVNAKLQTWAECCLRVIVDL